MPSFAPPIAAGTSHAHALRLGLPELLPRLWRFALRITKEQHDAEDLVQRTCVRALERAHQWLGSGSMLSWLFAIMHSIWLNELRANQRRDHESLDEWLEDGHEPSSAVAGTASPELRLHCQQVCAAVNALPEAQRMVMLLVAVEGLSYQEAATALDVPIGTVMSRLARARMAIGQQFAHPSPPMPQPKKL